MAIKKYDCAVKTGEYTDRNGDTKANWLNIGAIMQGDKGHYLILDRTFNPAGVPNPDNRSNLIVSLFEPKARDEQSQQQQRQNPAQSAPRPGQTYDNNHYDDDIPF